MSRRHRRDHHHERNERPGIIRRVTQGLGEKFGLPRGVVLAGFIVTLIMNAPLAIFLFLVALYWVDHPGKLERLFGWIGNTLHGIGSSDESQRRDHAYARPGLTDHEDLDPELEFRELRRQFDELEQRTGRMERHVASDEFRLNRELNRINGRDDAR